MITQTIRVNLNQKELETIQAVQSDTLREIAFEFYATDAEDAVQLDPDEFTVKFNMLKPDNNFVMSTFTDGIIKLTLNMTAVTGTGYYCILLMQDDEVIYSGNGKIIVNDHVIGSENIDSVSEADGYTFPDDFYTKDTPLAVLDDSTTSTTSTWSSEKIAEEIASIPGADIIDDTVTSTEKTWSSSKISAEVEAAAASEIDDNTTATDSTWSSAKIAEEISEATPVITKEVTGNPIEFSDGADAPLVKCTTTIQGYQEGTGTPSPDNVRPLHAYTESTISLGSKNILPLTVSGIKSKNTSGTWNGNVYTYNSITMTILTNDNNDVTGIKFNTSGASAETQFVLANITYKSDKKYYANSDKQSSVSGLVMGSVGFGTWNVSEDHLIDRTGAFDFSSDVYYKINNGATISNVVVYPMVRFYTSAGSNFVPYITPTDHAATFSQSIYQGNADFVGGKARATWGYIASYNGETLPGEWISSMDEYAPGTTPTTGAQVAYELASQTEETITPTNLPIKSLSGYNHIESSTGEMEIEYLVDEYQPIIDCIPAGPTYSTDEQITGTWTDGRPVYTRIIPVNATWQNIGTTSRQSFVYLQDWAKEIDIITELFIIGKDQYYGYTFNAAANLDRGYGTIEACWNDPFGGAFTTMPVECVRMSYVKTASVSRNLQRISDVNEVKELQDPVLEERREEEYEDEVHDQEMPEPGTYDTYRE